MTVPTYTYSNSSPHAQAQHGALADLLDDITRDDLMLLLDLPGAQCLDVGAGGGSVAMWLADQVGPDGAVTAVDTNTRLLAPWPGVTVLKHDITQGPVPGAYDLVHARLLLNHLPQRRTALRNMVESVKPGGVLLTADFLPTEGKEFVIDARTKDEGDLLRRFQDLHLQVLAGHGNDCQWSHQAAGLLGPLGLENVRQVPHDLGEWRGGGPGCQLLLAGLRQVQPELEDAGFCTADCDATAALLQDPKVFVQGYVLYSVSGHKSEAT